MMTPCPRCVSCGSLCKGAALKSRLDSNSFTAVAACLYDVAWKVECPGTGDRIGRYLKFVDGPE